LTQGSPLHPSHLRWGCCMNYCGAPDVASCTYQGRFSCPECTCCSLEQQEAWRKGPNYILCRDQRSKRPESAQRPPAAIFPPKDRSHPSKSIMAATVRLWRSEEDLGRSIPLFTMLYRRYPPKRFRLLRAAFCNVFSLLYTEGPYMCCTTAQMCNKDITGRMQCPLPGRVV
jgi:hypothetical protein